MSLHASHDADHDRLILATIGLDSSRLKSLQIDSGGSDARLALDRRVPGDQAPLGFHGGGQPQVGMTRKPAAAPTGRRIELVTAANHPDRGPAGADASEQVIAVEVTVKKIGFLLLDPAPQSDHIGEEADGLQVLTEAKSGPGLQSPAGSDLLDGVLDPRMCTGDETDIGTCVLLATRHHHRQIRRTGELVIGKEVKDLHESFSVRSPVALRGRHSGPLWWRGKESGSRPLALSALRSHNTAYLRNT